MLCSLLSLLLFSALIEANIQLTHETTPQANPNQSPLFQQDGPVTLLSNQNFTKVTGISLPPAPPTSAGQDWFILFYLDTCPHCRKWIPLFRKIVPHNFRLAALECSSSKVSLSFQIMRYPTMVYFRGSQKYTFPTESKMTLESVNKFIEGIQGNDEAVMRTALGAEEGVEMLMQQMLRGREGVAVPLLLALVLGVIYLFCRSNKKKGRETNYGTKPTYVKTSKQTHSAEVDSPAIKSESEFPEINNTLFEEDSV